METNLTSRTESEAKFTVAMTEADLRQVVKHVYDELRPRVKAAGFRPGKAPDAIVDRELGSGYVQNEVLEHAVQESYSRAIRQHELPVVAQPQINLEKFVPYTQLEYSATVELMPKVKLPKYQDYRFKRETPKVDAAEIEQTLGDLRRREAARVEVTRAAQLGDEVDFDFDGTKDGQPVRGASAQGHVLQLGSGQFIPGFEDELVGLKPGDDKTFDIRFPKDYSEPTLANEVVQFKVKLNKITELALPELDDELVAKVSPFQTVAELRDDIAKSLEARKTEESSRAYEQQILDRLVKETEIKAPESLVQQQLGRLRGELEQNLAYSGLNLEKYMELSKKSADDLDREMRPEAEKRVALAMVLTEVAAEEKITLSPEELDAEIARMKSQYQDEATQAELDRPETREEVYNHLMASRVIAKLTEHAESK